MTDTTKKDGYDYHKLVGDPKKLLQAQTVLKEIVIKAVKNDWAVTITKNYSGQYSSEPQKVKIDPNSKAEISIIVGEILKNPHILLTHDFAKSLWPEKINGSKHSLQMRASSCDYAWEWHLQQVVLKEDLIQYFIDLYGTSS